MPPDSPDLLDSSVRKFVESVAAKTPTPGGGSVAGVIGALATALGEMALVFTSGKKKYAAHQELYDRLTPRLAKARRMFLELVGDDMAAYSLYQDATRREDGPEKDQAVQLALAAATDVPREAAKLTLAVLEDFAALADKCSPYLISDLVAGAALAVAAIRLSDYNVRINVPSIADSAAAQEIHRNSAADVKRAEALFGHIDQAARKHLP
jgi:formiminotetrahydrofolate cyclodeaminase